MLQERLSLYMIDLKYVRDLANHDKNGNVRSISPQQGKSLRPFLGVIVICDNKQYCVPLSSPRAKHEKMNNDVDFSKIFNSKGKLIGVLNFNNMIPVRSDVITRIDLKIHPHDSQDIKARKNIMINQLTACRRDQAAIIAKANKLYRLVNGGEANASLKKRCCHFKTLEKVLEQYNRS
ncbi:MAG: type III toxin-antitoxin system ToxN/AbiQ family toxin [Anaerolineaceae bacterium]|nr:type III toxin-antitoxin system ToxN/AbiQ family toxin [Anaerolineaceae bacterium]